MTPVPCSNPVVVTGLGVWSAAGTTPDDLWRRSLTGGSPAAWFAPDSPRIAVCRAPDPEPIAGFPQARRMDRSVHLALAAVQQAYRQARLQEVDPHRIGLLVGNSRGPVGTWHEPVPARVRPSRAANSAVASLSGALSLTFGLRGPCLTVSATCASAAHAICLGSMLLQSGAADAVLVGGAEAPLVPPLLDQFLAAGLAGIHDDPRRACRPFDPGRNGMVPGEGAAFLVLELAEGALHRRLKPHAILSGSALGAEAHRRAAARADGEGLARVIRQALLGARIAPPDIGHVNAHGTGTVMNDAAEAAALRSIFAGRVENPPCVTSTKPVTGHALGASAALEAVLAIQALRHQLAPPTGGGTIPDPGLGLDVVVGEARPLTTRHVLSTSLGFWGNNAALIFSAWEDERPGDP